VTTEERCAEIRALTEELKTAERVAWDLQEENDRLREKREEDRRVFGNLLDAIEAEQAVGGVSAVTYSRALLNTLRARLATTEPTG
jgi:hypothetical protein